MSKTGIVVEGGGMKCVYGAGVLDALMDDGISFDYAIGVSAGAGNLASFTARQRGRNNRYFSIHSRDPHYLSVRNYLNDGNAFNLKWIYGTASCTGGVDPLDWEAMSKNPMEFVIVATDVETGQAVYFRKEEMAKDDYRVLAASCAIPVACQPVAIDGRKFCDGGVADPLPVGRALEDGCDRLLVIPAHPRGYVKPPEPKKLLYTRALRRYPNVVESIDLRHLRHKESMALAEKLELEGRAMILAPSREIDFGTFSKNTEEMEKYYRLGFEDYDRVRDRVRDMFGGPRSGAETAEQ
jgi:predicted patatin/cPLA2 family phospholipase